jgi:uncharacterized membrane protein YgcG
VPTGESLSARERSDIERAAVRAGSATGLVFTVCLLDAEGDSRGLARRLHGQLAEPARSVLVLVDPAARDLEIVTGSLARRRIDERAATLASLAMTSKFSIGDLAGGIVDGLQMLAEHGRQPLVRHHTDPSLG